MTCPTGTRARTPGPVRAGTASHSRCDRWHLHPDRALPANPAVRPIARQLYDSVADLPILSLHGHLDADMLAANRPFANPTQALLAPDHYLLRMLASQGSSLSEVGVPGRGASQGRADPREVFRRFAAGWHHFRGTPSQLWMAYVLVEIFGIDTRLSADSADATYDRIAELLARPEFRPLDLLDRFGVELLTTTDPAGSTLDGHTALRSRGWSGRVVPTFRPDALFQLRAATWAEQIQALSAASGIEVHDYRSFIAAIEQRRADFLRAGALASDHSATTIDTQPLTDDDATRVFDAALVGRVTQAQATAFVGHMLFTMARMSSEDGMVMQIHPGAWRDYDSRLADEYGADIGYDIPIATEYTRALRPLLNAWGHHRRFRLILFTLDESTFSRELAPLAGAYPSVLLGAPWWFLDAPDAMRRAREAVVESAGFSNLSGFVDDTRAFFSIPARHDLARRIDAGHLARLVAEHRLDLDEAFELAHNLSCDLPRRAYRLPPCPAAESGE